MAKELKLLTVLGMRSFLNRNEIRHTKDPKRKRRAGLVTAAGVMLVLMAFTYVGLYVYALCLYGLEALALSWLFLIASVLVFAVGIFRTGGTIFNLRGYDVLGSLPLKDSVIVGSRFLCCYLESLLFTLCIFLPGLGTYAYMLRPGAAMLLRALLCIPFVPLLPLSLTVLLSTLIKFLSGKLRNRSLVETALTLLLVLGILLGETTLGQMGEELTTQELVELSSAVEQKIAGSFPSCAWFSRFCVSGAFIELCKLIIVSLAVTAAILLLTVAFFRPVSLAMGSTARRKGGEAVGESRGLLAALYRREWKRYLACSIYVTNTVIGPLLALAGSVAVLFVDLEGLAGAEAPLGAVAPFILCSMLCMMPPAAVSISMEGKQRWISKSLPIPASILLDAKALLSLSLQWPCALVSSTCLCFALRPSLADGFFLFLLPLLIGLFTVELALTADAHLGSCEWEKEVAVVKQSASTFFGGLPPMLMSVAGAFAALYLPTNTFSVFRMVLSVLLLAGAVSLRRHNNRIIQ